MRTRKITITIFIVAMLLVLAVISGEPVCAAEDDLTRNNFFKTEFVYESKVLIDRNVITIDKGKYGLRRIVLITGGTFKGPNIEGTIIPGGADWQLVRPDGVTELDARYVLKTNDGVMIYANNHILARPQPIESDPKGQYCRCMLNFEAPIGSKYEWLNQFVFLGTLNSVITEKEAAVIIRVWKLL